MEKYTRIAVIVVLCVLGASAGFLVAALFDFGNATLVDNFDLANPDAYLGGDFEILGILTVVEDKDCNIPEGCGPTYKLRSSDFKSYLPLLGQLQHSDSEKLIIAKGKIIELPKSEYKDINYMGSKIALQVSNYKKLGDIKYHGYLMDKSTEYVINKFGCVFSHDKSFGFVVVGDKAYLKIRWTFSTREGRIEDKYYELWVDPSSGEIVKEIDKINDISVCASEDIETTPLPPAWHLMTETVFLWENGKEQFVAGENSDLSNFLFQTLHRLNLQAKCVFSEERIQEIKENDKVIEMRFRHPEQITIRQWIEPYRSNVKYDENGYRVLENVKSTLFIQEDNLDEGLEAHVLVDSFEGYSCWAIQQEGSDELDKVWIAEINRLTDKKYQKPVISVSSSVFEGGKEMTIYNDGRVTSGEYHIYPSSKRITIREGNVSEEEINALLNLFSNLTEYEYTVTLTENIKYLFEPFGNAKISCIPLNKTLSLGLRPPSFPEPETATITAKELLERIDKIYAGAEISEIRDEFAGPYSISLNIEPFAESYGVNQIITFNASLRWLPFTNRTKSHDKTLRYSYTLADNYTVEWDFGDGSKGYGEIVSHSYSSPGNYRVKLRVSTARGGVEIHGTETYRAINITHSPPSVTPVQSPKVSGFEAVFTIAGLLAVAYLRRR